MKRRHFIWTAALGLGVLAGGFAVRPGNQGQPYSEYFKALNEELKRHGPMQPVALIDLDALDHNIEVLAQAIKTSGKHLRLVAKSLPSPDLLRYLSQRLNTQRLMSFHQPFLNQDARLFEKGDILLGKPLPARAAQIFYQQHRGAFDPAKQLQWLVDTPACISDYLALAQGLNTRIRLNVELDVGLHRGGARTPDELAAMLRIIEANPAHLEFSGLMGYDPFVGMNLPGLLTSADQQLAKVMARYQAQVDLLTRHFPKLGQSPLTLNTAGSPSYPFHLNERLSSELSVGTALLKPSHYDLPSLAAHRPAVFIATPVLKSLGAVDIPVLDQASQLLSAWDVNQRQSYFIYGGNWLADPYAPAGLKNNALYGRSSNQELLTGSFETALSVGDQVFFRPQQSEAVLLEFGDLWAVRGGKLVERWPVYQESFSA